MRRSAASHTRVPGEPAAWDLMQCRLVLMSRKVPAFPLKNKKRKKNLVILGVLENLL